MAVFFTEVEAKLTEQLQLLYKERQLWKMVIFQGSNSKEYMHFLASTEGSMLLVDTAKKSGAMIFRLHDSKLVFLFSSQENVVFPLFLELVKQLFPGVSTNEIDFESSFKHYNLALQFDEAMHFAMEKNRETHTRNEPAKVAPSPWYDKTFRDALNKRAGRAHPMVALVEDDASLRHLAWITLRDKYEIISAGNGIAALEIYNRQAPDLVFLDIDMPGMDGLEVLQRILKEDGNARIVMFSSHKTQEKVTSALRLGAKGYVVKPFTAAALINHAEQALKP